MVEIDRITGLGEALTEREREILACLVEGLSNGEIAARLHLAVKTVKWYNSQIYSKLGVTNRQEAIEIAVANSADQKAPSSHRHNLPVQMTPFVGREAELAEMGRLLGDPLVKLVTILAPGGMGKTRVALEAARHQLANFADGVFFVPLAPLTSFQHILTMIAEQVGFQFYGSEDAKSQLLNYFRERRALLVLDNCEHLPEGTPLVTDLIQFAPQVKVLATSREKLSLSGETVFALSGLDFPNAEAVDRVEYDAVKLFILSARRVRPEFAPTHNDLKSIANICRLTAGMPLGIVLAAGWLDAMTLEQIAVEIQKGSDILETELWDVPERQRSVRATFNTSWERLTEAEREAFMKLSVFRGGFTPAAAEVVAGADIRALRRLVNKSLLQADASGRYAIQELLRQYGEQKLADAGQKDALGHTHCGYFADFMRERAGDVKGRRQLGGLNEIEADFSNIRVAWAWAIAQGEAAALDGMLESLHLFCDMRARYRDGEVLFGQAVSEWTPQPGQVVVWQRLRAREAAMWLLQQEKAEESRLQLEECQQAALARGDQAEVAFCLFLLGEAAEFLEDWDGAIQLFQRSHTLFKSLEDPFYAARVLRPLAHLYGFEPRKYGDLHLRMTHELYEATRAIGDRTGMGHAILYMGMAESTRGHYAEAQQLYSEAEAVWQEMGDRKSAAIVRNITVSDLFSSGECERAEKMAEENLVIGVDINFPNIRRGALVALSRIAAMREDYARAYGLVNSIQTVEASPPTYFPASCEVAMAEVGLRNFAAARYSLYNALRAAFDFAETLDKLMCLPVAAAVLAHEGQKIRAVEVLALASSKPPEMVGWMDKWPLLARLRNDLVAELGAEVYAAAWERGKALELDAVVEALMGEFGEPGS